MTDTAHVPGNPGRPPIVHWDGALGRIESGFNFLAGLSILVLILLAVVQVLGRSLFNMPVPGFIDIVEQAMALFAFLGIAYCQRLGGHVRMELVISQFKGRGLWISELISTLVIMLLVTALIYGSWFHFQRAWDFGDSTIDIQIPTWPSKLVVPVALSLLWLRLLLQAFGFARLVHDPGKAPVAVPLIENVTEHAQHEIEEAFGDDAENPEGEARS
ncbi:TRAP transporter small permease subunit [Coralliovum pocilloporae]|uniref:TRAP transporter small permease subunit n=1 Tax=Coralliovum pocilloporae TaxID=3066369 RepID=UPI003306EBD3